MAPLLGTVESLDCVNHSRTDPNLTSRTGFRFLGSFPASTTMALVLRFLLLFSLLSAALRAADANTAPAAPRKVELGVHILDITDIDEPGGKFTLHVLLGVYWQDSAQVHEGKGAKVFRED